MTTLAYTYYESRITGAQRMRTASNLGTGDNRRIMFHLNFVLQYIHRHGGRALVPHAALPALTARVWSNELLWNNGQFISIILSAIGVLVEYQPPIIRHVYNQAVCMTATPASDGANLAHMEVTIYAVTHVLLEEELMPSLEEETLLEPATKSSIEALERIRVNDGDPMCVCTICIEELAGGTEATKMPCSHVYHVDCIRQWLETSHSCPLCRYAMPTQQLMVRR
ncbi:probable E3 ubiquitin-protein ligase RHA4A [Syzygium oleosum]|uniref:probable E3 ubiquitin-protein ligase RHA4A n=1 Tax=Syzygium oleosum TaxID=219896 RepID=UPI0024B97C32|nr:probable E3 ubiquitin-protein ligase RHA4A [Syzygium oleosum]